MATKSTLRSYLDDYINRKSKSIKSFSEYLNKYLLGASASFEDAIKDAGINKMTSLPSYSGVKAELVAKGLANSGYASYLKAAAQSEYDSARNAAVEKRNLSEARGLIGYEGYLENAIKKDAELKSKVTDELIKYNLVKRDKAIDYATRVGFSADDAELIADKAYLAARAEIFDKMVDRVRGGLSAEEAIAMGEELGLRSSELRRLKKYAEDYKKKIEKEDSSTDQIIEDLANNRKDHISFR